MGSVAVTEGLGGGVYNPPAGCLAPLPHSPPTRSSSNSQTPPAGDLRSCIPATPASPTGGARGRGRGCHLRTLQGLPSPSWLHQQLSPTPHVDRKPELRQGPHCDLALHLGCSLSKREEWSSHSPPEVRTQGTGLGRVSHGRAQVVSEEVCGPRVLRFFLESSEPGLQCLEGLWNQVRSEAKKWFYLLSPLEGCFSTPPPPLHLRGALESRPTKTEVQVLYLGSPREALMLAVLLRGHCHGCPCQKPRTL